MTNVEEQILKVAEAALLAALKLVPADKVRATVEGAFQAAETWLASGLGSEAKPEDLTPEGVAAGELAADLAEDAKFPKGDT